MQYVELIGNLGKDGELRYAQSGTPVCKLSLACNDRRTKEVTWYSPSIFGKRAEALVKHLVKGKQVFVAGNLEINPKNDGDGVWLNVSVDRIEFMGSNGKRSNGHPEDNEPEEEPI